MAAPSELDIFFGKSVWFAKCVWCIQCSSSVITHTQRESRMHCRACYINITKMRRRRRRKMVGSGFVVKSRAYTVIYTLYLCVQMMVHDDSVCVYNICSNFIFVRRPFRRKSVRVCNRIVCNLMRVVIPLMGHYIGLPICYKENGVSGLGKSPAVDRVDR